MVTPTPPAQPPDDDLELFERLAREMDTVDTPEPDRAVTAASPQPQAPEPDAADKQEGIPTSPAPAPVAPPPTPEPVTVRPSLPQPVKPERPALVEPTAPKPPELGRAEQTGHVASLAGYVMSVGVGAFGQIMFLGTWLEAMLPSPGNWIAALIGAAFAEIGMIGAGNSSLSKRRDGGRWKLLFAVACFVCAGAVTMQVAHWLPKGFGVALVFGLASFVGFLIHMTIEHSKIRDHEDRMAKYETEMAAYRAEQQARYEQDLAAYEAAVEEEHKAARRRDVRQSRAVAVTARETPSEPLALAPSPAPRQIEAATQGSEKLTYEVAREWAEETGTWAPAEVNGHFERLGYERVNASTIRRWRSKADETAP